VPIRKNGDGWMPAAGAGGGADWIAWVPPRDLPAVRDPPSGRVINANNTVIDGDYPYRLGREFAEPYRARRIASLLIGIDKATPSDMAAIQLDVRSTMVDAALPILLRDTPRTADTGAVLDLLSRWDGSMRHDRPEPLIFTAWWRHLIAALYADELKDLATAVSPRPAVVLRSLNSRQIWCDDVATPTVVETCPSRLQLALARALAELRAAYGNDPAQWRWGVPHRSRLRHPVLSRIPVIGAWFELSVPTHGDRYTVNVGGHPIMDPKDPYGHTSGAGYRAIYDLAALDRSLFQIVGGQSGNPLSPHFGDRMTDWAEGRYATISAEPAAVAGRLRLRPDHAR
jgi:penicillin amidase